MDRCKTGRVYTEIKNWERMLRHVKLGSIQIDIKLGKYIERCKIGKVYRDIKLGKYIERCNIGKVYRDENL